MAARKREDEVFPNAAGIDIGGSSHWVAVPPHLDDDAVREFGPMTSDLRAIALIQHIRRAARVPHDANMPLKSTA